MALTDFMGITEISRCTGKTRPTVYKYLRSYEEGSYDDIPYTFLMLLQLAERADTAKADILAYCRRHYGTRNAASASKPPLEEIIELLRENAEQLDLAALKERLTKEIQEHE